MPDMLNGEPFEKSSKITATQLENYKRILQEKGSHKDWTQREIALNTMQECFSQDV